MAIPTILTESLPPAQMGKNYYFTLECDDPNAIWKSSGTFPAGMWRQGDSGLVRGTPVESGEFPLTFTVTNADGSSSKDFILTVPGSKPTIVNNGIPLIRENTSVGTEIYVLYATGGGPITFFPGRDFPNFLELVDLPDGLSCVIKTTRELVTEDLWTLYSFEVGARNSSGEGFRSFTTRVLPELTVSPGYIPTGKVGEEFSGRVNASHVPSYWENDNLPEGLSINSLGSISGIPKVAGTYDVTVRAIISDFYAEDWVASTTFALMVLPSESTGNPGADWMILYGPVIGLY